MSNRNHVKNFNNNSSTHNENGFHFQKKMQWHLLENRFESHEIREGMMNINQIKLIFDFGYFFVKHLEHKVLSAFF